LKKRIIGGSIITGAAIRRGKCFVDHTALKYICAYLRLMLFAALFPPVPAHAEYSPNLRIDGEVSAFLMRLSARYGIALPRSFYCQPMYAADVLRFLDSADALDKAGRITPWESARLKRLRRLAGGKPNVLTVKQESLGLENHLNFSAVGEIHPSYNDSGSVRAAGILRPEMSGAVRRLSYFSAIDVWTEMRTDTTYYVSTYQPFNGIAYNLYGRNDSSSHPAIRASDMLRAGISLSLAYVNFETAIDDFRTGPASLYPLTFSAYAPPLTYFRTRMTLAVADYFHAFGQLRCQKNRDKYFHMHRLEFPLRRLHLVAAINEAVVYGSTAELAQSDSLRPEYYGVTRRLEWIYLIPFVPYAFAEHYGGDMDNKLMSFDLSLLYPAGWRWYGEFLLDDFTNPLTLFSNDWGNKWALTAGMEYFGCILHRDFRAGLEYSRVEPWVYTHFYGGSHSYTHFGQSLGSPLGPNNAAVALEGEMGIGKSQSVGVRLCNIRTNHSVRGGTIDDVFQDGKDAETKAFLGPGTSHDNTVALFWSWDPFSIFTIRCAVQYSTRGRVDMDVRARCIF